MLKTTSKQNELIVKYIYEKCGINLRDKAYLIESKIALECFTNHINSFEEYWQQISVHDGNGQNLRQRLIDALTTNYSYFYREDDHFQLLEQYLAEGKIGDKAQEIRGWCAGCANGQEAYTLAMTMEDAHLTGSLKKPYKLWASDISQKAIQTATKGIYSMAEYVRVPANWRKAYMHLLPNGCEVRKNIKQNLSFKQENILLPDQTRGKFDYIFCRNVLIYFDEVTYKKLLKIFWDSLQPDGYLFLGHTEIFNKLAGFQLVKPAVYQKVSE